MKIKLMLAGVTAVLLGTALPFLAMAGPSAVWEVPRYGQILSVASDGKIEVYSQAAGVCASTDMLSTAEDSSLKITPSRSGRTAHLKLGISQYDLIRIKSLPRQCRSFHPKPGARTNFDALTSIFDESFPFFQARGVDWPRLRSHYSAQAKRAVDEDQLWEAMTGLLTPLRDSHVTLTDGADRRWNLGRVPRQTTPDPDGIVPSGKGLRTSLLDWLKGPQSPLKAAPNLLAGGLIVQGITNNGSCYLAFLAMDGFAGDEATPDENESALEGALNQSATVCSGLKRTVIDLRYNPGGDDRFGLIVAGRLTDAPYVAYRKRAFGRGMWSARYDVSALPSRQQHLPSPIAVLIGPRTTSAAETTALALQSLKQSILVGATSQGAMSDMLNRTLPNGWQLTLSNEEYSSPSGKVYEGSGVPPSVAVEEPTDKTSNRFGTALHRAEFELMH